MDKVLWTVKDVAAKTSQGITVVRADVTTGKLKVVRRGRRLFVTPAELARYVQSIADGTIGQAAV